MKASFTQIADQELGEMVAQVYREAESELKPRSALEQATALAPQKVTLDALESFVESYTSNVDRFKAGL